MPPRLPRSRASSARALPLSAIPHAYGDLKDALAGTGIEVGAGESGLIEAAERPADWVHGAITGAAGLKPTLAAADRGAIVALANKEMPGLRRRPVHAARGRRRRDDAAGRFRAQCAVPGDERRAGARTCGRVILTASGGPFRTWTSADAIRDATVEQALKHPNWSMGPKVTIDSATLMNKGLELIEAHHLFALPSDQIDVLVHPQSIVHGLVEFRDGSMIAQLGSPDMRVPIAYCLAWPERIEGPAPRLDLAAQSRRLSFEEPDLARFPALALARRALEAGGGSADCAQCRK